MSMFSNALKQLMSASKQVCCILLIQLLAVQILFANNTLGQNLNQVSITFEAKDNTLKEVFIQIEEKTDFVFLYDESVSRSKVKFSLSKRTIKIAELLDLLSVKFHLKYQQLNKSISVSMPEKYSQLRKTVITGTVKDAQTGEPLPGTSVLFKGSTTGTITDMEGRYKLSSDRALTNEDVIIFRFLGYQTLELLYDGRTVIDVVLQEDEKTLETVVVTALGIERDQKALGYATQELGAGQLNDARSNNWAAALSGKVAGLTMNSSGSGPINSTRIVLRGDNNLDPSANNALIVLDGVPLNNTITESGVSSAYGAGSGSDVPIDFGNAVSDINPDDIESITVLKGASATALYGNRAMNGALIITTKSGARKKKGIGVTLNSNVNFQTVLKWPDYQYEYGQGTGAYFNEDGEWYYSYKASEDGGNTGSTSSAFGPKFDGQMYYQYDPTVEGQSLERQLWRPYEDNIKGFWRTGSTVTNSIALSGGDENSSVRASITHSKNEWIMPNTGYERINSSLSLNHKLTDRLKLSAKVNYANKKSDNLPATGYNNQSIAYFMIFQNPNVDLSWYEPIWKEGQNQVDQIHPFSSYIDNPYMIAYEMTNSINSHTMLGNLSATYEFSDKFDLMVRSAINLGKQEREMKRPFSSANYKNGYYKIQNISNYEVNTDALLTYKDKLSDRIDLRISLGGNMRSEEYRRTDLAVDGLVTPGVYKLSNGINNPTVTPRDWNRKVNSMYGLATFSYNDMIFVDITGRNDWYSVLPSQNNAYFYPSISTGFVLSEMFSLPSPVSYAKLRLSAAQVGSDTSPYRDRSYYGLSDFPSSASVPTTLPNIDIEPMQSLSYEAGLEYYMFQRRFGMDLTFYQTITNNQILDVPVDPTTGYSRAVMNGGEIRNRGIELVLNGTPVQTENFRWNTTVTWSKNYNKVLSLPEELTDEQIIGSGGNATLIAKVGGTTGDIYGYGFVRSPEGEIVYDAESGLPVRPDEIQYIGNAYADWKGGWNNEFKYKNFRFSFLLDGQYGGIIYSQTHHKMSEQGKLKHTLAGREDGFIVGDGVVLNEDGTYSSNTTEVAVQKYYKEYYRRANVEANSFDASYLKLREVRLEYNLPKEWLRRIAIERASVAVYGRDLMMITNFPIFDPETAALNGSTILPGIEMGQLPSTRIVGVNLTLEL
ncbi:SusC/RagA family TonB-linked outer membrane protein [Limibacter armeniacum]|uniref:SusC/RagA family TonB-linked outer membrane protein n=1 Tax=Limibacter armeniacum TaxID=466084 RepID=UPI002FE50B03